MQTVYSITQQLGSSPEIGPGRPMVKLTGIGPVKGELLVYFMSLVALLFELELPEAVSLNNCNEVEPFIEVPGIKIIPDSSTLLTPSVQAEGLAV
tara:strand:+ start:1939 stop:2223 length:285 start_codon:yes stop_codon:yes gene_type:complete